VLGLPTITQDGPFSGFNRVGISLKGRRVPTGLSRVSSAYQYRRVGDAGYLIMKENDDNINFFCALDWATQKHYYILQDKSGKTLSEGYFINSSDGYEEFLGILKDHAGGQRVALIFEAVRGAPMNVLIGIKWLKLCPVNPIKTKKLSELEGVSGGKSDPRDTRLLCDYLRMSYRKCVSIIGVIAEAHRSNYDPAFSGHTD